MSICAGTYLHHHGNMRFRPRLLFAQDVSQWRTCEMTSTTDRSGGISAEQLGQQPGATQLLKLILALMVQRRHKKQHFHEKQLQAI